MLAISLNFQTCARVPDPQARGPSRLHDFKAPAFGVSHIDKASGQAAFIVRRPLLCRFQAATANPLPRRRRPTPEQRHRRQHRRSAHAAATRSSRCPRSLDLRRHHSSHQSCTTSTRPPSSAASRTVHQVWHQQRRRALTPTKRSTQRRAPPHRPLSAPHTATIATASRLNRATVHCPRYQPSPTGQRFGYGLTTTRQDTSPGTTKSYSSITKTPTLQTIHQILYYSTTLAKSKPKIRQQKRGQPVLSFCSVRLQTAVSWMMTSSFLARAGGPWQHYRGQSEKRATSTAPIAETARASVAAVDCQQ